MLNIYNFLNQIAFTRVSGTEEEYKCALMIKEELDKLNIENKIIPFEVSKFKTSKAILKSVAKEYNITAYDNTLNINVTAPFYYMETTLDIDIDELNNKIVLVNGLLNQSIYDKLVKGNALAFITYTGELLDTEENSDLFTKELRKRYADQKMIPGCNMRAKEALELVLENPKELTLILEQEKIFTSSHNVFASVLGEKDEVITITAHFDSVDFSKGAYDNGAGSALILKLAEYFSINKPKRTLNFIWCGSEERGLLGSTAYVNNLSEEELNKIIFNINVDVAGAILGSDTCIVSANEQLVNYLEGLTKEQGILLKVVDDIYSSDSIPFVDKGIPAINLMRFGTRGTAYIHDRNDTMAFISEKSLNNTYNILEHISKTLINSKTFVTKKQISEQIKNKVIKYLGKDTK